MGVAFLYRITPNLVSSKFENVQAEEYPEITNVAPKSRRLSNDEKRLIANGNKILAAIEKYLSENGDYPTTLKSLVPDYIEEIPKTGYTRSYLFSFKIEEAAYRYHATLIKERPQFAGFYISVRYGMFDEWSYSSYEKVWEHAVH